MSKEYPRNIQGISKEYPENIQGISREYPINIHGIWISNHISFVITYPLTIKISMCTQVYQISLPPLVNSFFVIKQWMVRNYIPWILIGYFLDIPWIFLGFSLDVPVMFLGYSLDIPWIFLGYSLDIPWIFFGYSSFMI